MVKATARLDDGRTLLVLGLSFENVRRLMANQPIDFDMATLSVPADAPVGKVCIFCMQDEAELARTMKGFIGPETDVRVIPKPAPGQQ